MRILLITPNLPWPAQVFGGAQRTELMIRALSGVGEVELMVIPTAVELGQREGDALRLKLKIASDFGVSEIRPAGMWRSATRVLPGPLGRMGNRLAMQRGYYAAESIAARWVAERVAERRYDLIVSRYLRPAMLADVPSIRSVPTILDFDDVDWLRMERQVCVAPWPGWKGRVGAWAARKHLRYIARRALRCFSHVWTTSPDDQRAIAPVPSTVLPNIPFAPAGATLPVTGESDPDSRVILFVGLLDYPPNRDGLDCFLQRVWPLVRAAESRATLWVVGARLAEEVRARWSAVPGVRVIGYLAELETAYRAAAFTVAPVTWGGGTKIKVLESLARGRTCVVTPHALHGLAPALRHGESVWRAGGCAAFAEGCIALLHEPALRERLARHGEQVVKTEFSYARFEDAVHTACREVYGRTGRTKAIRGRAARSGGGARGGPAREGHRIDGGEGDTRELAGAIARRSTGRDS